MCSARFGLRVRGLWLYQWLLDRLLDRLHFTVQDVRDVTDIQRELQMSYLSWRQTQNCIRWVVHAGLCSFVHFMCSSPRA